MKKGTRTNKQEDDSSIPQLSDRFLTDLQSEDNCFYMYGGAIVEPSTDTDSKIASLKHLKLPDLKWYLRRAYPGKSEQTIRAVAEDVLYNPVLPFAQIRGLVTTPTFRPDLTLVTSPGFDPESGLYYAPDRALQEWNFRTDANKDRASESLELIFELLKDFPFTHNTEKLNWIATLLTLFLRSSIPGIVPALGIDGNGQSVGKGLLSSMISLIAFGADNASMSVPANAAEWSSKLDSILLKGTTFQVIDNIVGKFGNDDLASVMTATKRHVRIKGTSNLVDVPIKLLWIFNGNNITLDSDMAQRVMMCRLEHADPTSRKQEQFHIQKKYGMSILKLLENQRPKYMQACLDIICGWVNAHGGKRKNLVMAKYDEWEAIIGGIFDWIRPDAKFLSGHLEDVVAFDAEREETINFLRQIMNVFPSCGDKQIGAGEITDEIFPVQGRSRLRDFVPDALASIAGGSSFSKRLGRWLKNASTRRWGSIELCGAKDPTDNVWKYLIGLDIKKLKKVQYRSDQFLEDDEFEAA